MESQGIFQIHPKEFYRGRHFRNRFLLEVSRQSRKRAMEARAKAELLTTQLVEWCCREYGLTVEPPEITFNAERQR